MIAVTRWKNTLSLLLMVAAFQAVAISAMAAPADVADSGTAIRAARLTAHTPGARIYKPLLVEPVAVGVVGRADAVEQEFTIEPPPDRATLSELHGIPLGSRPPPAAFVAA